MQTPPVPLNEKAQQTFDYDVAVIGAGPAGLNAALILGGALRSVLLFDGGPPRNARAQAARGVFTRDGAAPADLKRLGLADLAPYAVTVCREEVRAVREQERGFVVRYGDTEATVRRVLLATGVQDVLPRVPGLSERWGHTVLHCPYCDGWPNREARLAVLGSHQEGHHLALSVRAWTEHVTLLTDGPDELTGEQRRDLEQLGIERVTTPLSRLTGKEGVTAHLEGGGELAFDAIFLNPTQVQKSGLPEMLGCELDDRSRVVVNEHGMTSLRGVWAAGDMTGAPQYVTSAAASGQVAAVSLNSTLIHEDVRAHGAAFHSSPDEKEGVGEA